MVVDILIGLLLATSVVLVTAEVRYRRRARKVRIAHVDGAAPVRRR